MTALPDAQLHFWDPTTRHYNAPLHRGRVAERDLTAVAANPLVVAVPSETARSSDAGSAVRR